MYCLFHFVVLPTGGSKPVARPGFVQIRLTRSDEQIQRLPVEPAAQKSRYERAYDHFIHATEAATGRFWGTEQQFLLFLDFLGNIWIFSPIKKIHGGGSEKIRWGVFLKDTVGGISKKIPRGGGIFPHGGGSPPPR